MYYDSGRHCLTQIAGYEANLIVNLNALLNNINDEDL
jgi:hypothetical protein